MYCSTAANLLILIDMSSTTLHSILEATRLSVGYISGSPVIADISARLEAGYLAVLVGANGSGKSTLLRTLSGAQAPLAGSVEIMGKRVGDYSRRGLARVLSMVYTDRTMAGGLTVSETVAVGRQPHTGVLGRMSEADREAVAKALDDVGMSAKANNFLANLSDGERQKVMIARALAQDTPLVILDEPTAFLDVASRLEIMGLLRCVASRESGRSVLLSSHDIAPALSVADDVWLVDSTGRRLICGQAGEMIGSGLLDLAFPGRDVRFDASRLDYVLATGALE